MAYDRTKPFNDIPSLPPAVELETREILKQAIESHRALAELKHIGALLPNQAVLINTLGLQEAKLSSEIENIVTTNDELYRAHVEKELNLTPETKEVLHYQDALWYGFKALKEEKRMLTTPLFEELCQIIKEHASGVRKTGGTKLVNGMGEITYTPPEGETLIRNKLQDLEKFMHGGNEIDSLIKLALIHYQFESIHPFHDGNGRTGRIINILYLVDKGLLDLPILYLSRYFLHNKLDYYGGFRRVTEEGKWQEWVCFILKAIEHTSRETQKKITEIYNLMQTTAQQVKSKLTKIYSKDLMEVLFSHPYCKIRFLENAKIAQRQAGSKYLQELERIGVLRSIQHGREKYYINDKFLKILSS